MYGIGPKLPIRFTKESSPLNTQTITENTKQNMKNLLLTSPGERIMDINFGVGLRRFLFENNTPTARVRLESRIYEQVDRYMSFVNITELEIVYSDDNPNLIDIKMRYDIKNIASDEILSLSLDPKITS
jgi:phage baseplate assembly protein W